MRPLPLLVPPLLCAAACAASVNDTTEPEPDPDPVVVALPIPDEILQCAAPPVDEPIGEACGEWSTGCLAACAALAAVGCGGVAFAAVEASIISVGSLFLPAGLAVMMACGATGGACAVLCEEYFS